MAITKADAMKEMLGEIAESIEAAREGDRDDLFGVCDRIVQALGILNRRLSKVEGPADNRYSASK